MEAALILLCAAAAALALAWGRERRLRTGDAERDRRDLAEQRARRCRELEVLGHELRIDSMDAPRFLQVNALALRDGGGASDGAILVFHDLTRLRQLEGVRQEFVANVSHELRTPLSLIK